MRTYQTVGLLLVVGGLISIAGMHAGERHSSASPAAREASDGSCCTVPVNPAAKAAPKVKIPTGSGRPCLVEFGSDECNECQRMAVVLQQVTPQLKASTDVVAVDTDLHPGEAQRWRLRMVPTQILVDPQGQELWRHEGYFATGQLLAKVKGSTRSTP